MKDEPKPPQHPRENERWPGQNQGPGSPADRHDNAARHPIRPKDETPPGTNVMPSRKDVPKKGRPPSPTEDRAVNPALADEDRQRLPGDGSNAFGEEAD